MKKYIGLTLYLVGLVLLSYTFFYFSGKKTIKKETNLLLTGGQVDSQKVDSGIINSNNTFSGEDITFVSSGNENTGGNIISETSGNDLSGDIQLIPLTGQKEDKIDFKNTLSGTILADNPNFKLVKVTPYDDIFDILGYNSGYAYQLKGKDLYLKVLKSVDYETEKSNINQLIQQIGGNINQTNLFGEKQFFINIDAYYGKVVVMVVEYKKNLYLIVMPYSLYKEEKNYLKNVLFAK